MKHLNKAAVMLGKHRNTFSAGTPPQTPLIKELAILPQTL